MPSPADLQRQLEEHSEKFSVLFSKLETLENRVTENRVRIASLLGKCVGAAAVIAALGPAILGYLGSP